MEQFVAEGRVVYGITTGFGAFKDKLIPPDQARELQRNIMMSHAVGVGAPFVDGDRARHDARSAPTRWQRVIPASGRRRWACSCA